MPYPISEIGFAFMEEGKDQPTLEAWAIFSHHEATFDLFVSPALYDTPSHELVMDEYVAWAEARARGWGETDFTLLGDGL